MRGLESLEHFIRTAAACFVTAHHNRIIRRKDQYMKQKKMEPRNSRHEQLFHERCVKEKSAEEQIKGVFDRILDEMAKEMDRGYMEAGKTLAELFRAVATAAAKLPNLELRTEMMTVKNGDDGLSIVFKRDEAKPAFLDDEEEEQLYGED
jgi:hypothetical protein